MVTIFHIEYSAYDDKNIYIFQAFYSSIYELKNLFTVDEIYELNPDTKSEDVNVSYVFTLSDDRLVELIQRYTNQQIQYEIFNCIKSDVYREQALSYIKKSNMMDIMVSQFDNEDLIIKHLKRVPYSERGYVISKLDNDYYKEKFLTIFRGSKSTIIKSLSTDEKKIYYLKRYSLFLDKYDKAEIVASFENVDNIIKYFHVFKEDEDLINYLMQMDFDVLYDLCKRVKNEKFVSSVLLRDYDEFSLEQATELLDLLKDGTLIATALRFFPDEIKARYIEKVGQDNRREIISVIVDPYLKMSCLKYLEKFSDIESVIEHSAQFPKYSDEYEYLIDKYATCYNLNKNNLLYLVKNFDMAVLRVIKNDNLKKLINTDEQSFYKVLELFSKENVVLNAGAMNDVLNSLLQREFKLANTNVVLIFPLILQAIEFGKNEEAINLINNVIDEFKVEFDVEEHLKTCGYTKESFIQKVLEKDRDTVELLHDITTRYIRFKRNEYIKDNIGAAKENSMDGKINNKSYIKCLFNFLPTELILKMFPESNDRREKDWFIKRGFTLEEIDLLNNRELLTEIIKYRKNPSMYKEVPLEVKKNLGLFNKLFEKILEHSVYYRTMEIGASKEYSFKEVNIDDLIAILTSLDIDKLKLGVLNNQEKYDMLVKFLKQYRMLGWGNSFDSVLSGVGINVDSEIIANFMQYFTVIYSELEEKVRKGQLGNISLTAMMDLAACFSSESNKYSYLFGNEDFKLIASNPGPNSSSMVKEKRISKAVEYLRKIRTRDYVSVPPMDKDFELKNGKKMNAVVGNFSNPINLTYGERTGACMRIGGAGSSLYDFCLNNDHGFHIRFCNPITGGFVSRVSGFRNGNTVFLNQLRTSTDSRYTNEDVIEACKLVAQELVELSRGSNSPIDNVVVTNDYAMSGLDLLNNNLELKI